MAPPYGLQFCILACSDYEPHLFFEVMDVARGESPLRCAFPVSTIAGSRFWFGSLCFPAAHGTDTDVPFEGE